MVAAERWASWAAVSSQPQAAEDKISLGEQLRLNAEHAGRHGGRIVAELVVPGESRSIDTWEEACERIEAYAQLRDLLQRRAFDVLCYYDASRLARTLSLGATIRQLCHRRGVVLYQTSAPPSDLRAGWRHDIALVDAIQQVGAQEEVARLQERHRMGMINRVRRGNIPGRPSYGYAVRYAPDGERSLVVDDAQAVVVRRIVARYLAGAGCNTILAELNADGVPSPTGKPWGETMILNVLDHVWLYAGWAELNRRSDTGRPYVRGRGSWPPILAEATAERVQGERAQRARNRRLPQPYRLSGVCLCAACGRYLSVGTVQRARASVQLRCDRYHQPGTYIREPAVLAPLRRAILALGALDLGDWEMFESDPADHYRDELAGQEAAQERLAAALRRADDAYVTGLMDAERYTEVVDRLKTQLSVAERERQSIRAALEAETARGTRRQRMERVRDLGLTMLEHPDIAACNRWLREVVRVTVERNAVIEIAWL